MMHALLVVPKEHLDREPPIATHLEAIGQIAELLHLLICQAGAVKLPVGFNPGRRDGLRDHACISLEAPQETVGSMSAHLASTVGHRVSIHLQDLSGSLALVVGNLLKSLILREWAVGRTKARVCGTVDALLFAVIYQLWRGIVGVQLYLVDRRRCLAAWVIQQLLKIPDGEVGDSDVYTLD